MFYKILAIAIVVFTASCASTVHVDKDTSDNKTVAVEGVPFYIKKQQFVHTSVHTATWLSTTLTVKKYIGVPSKTNDKAFETVSYNKQISHGDAAQLNAIRQSILDSNGGDVDTAKGIIKNYLNLPSSGGESNATMSLASNKVTSQWVVDGGQKYYLNAPLPWFGTSSLTQKISADGTLSEVIAAPDTKLAEGLSTLVPFKEYLTGRYVTTLTDQTDDATVMAELADTATEKNSDLPAIILGNKTLTTQVYVLSLAVEETGYEYTFERVSDTRPEDTTPIEFDTAQEQFTRRPLKGASEGDAKKDTSPKIGISGEVKLPEGWGEPAS